MPGASVVRELNCIKCGKPLVRDGKVKCPRCKQEIELPVSLPKGKWFCPECQAHGFEKPRVLAIAGQIRCRWCKTKNSLIQKEEQMSQPRFSERDKKQEMAKILADYTRRQEEYQQHQVYYIEEGQLIVYIPGGTQHHRVKYIYDQADKIALIKEPLKKNVKLLRDRDTLKKLEEVIQHRIKALNKGTFVREFQYSTRLFDLLEVMHGYNIPKGIDPQSEKEESENRYQARKQDYLNHLFDFVIS